LGEFARLLRQPQPEPLARARLSLSLLGLWAVCGFARDVAWTTPLDAPPLSVGLVQGNIEQNLKFAQVQDSLNRYASLTDPLWQHDLVVWPETAIPLVYQR